MGSGDQEKNEEMDNFAKSKTPVVHQIETCDPNGIEDSTFKLHQSFREKVAHEDGLINTRTTWFLVSQTFLLGTFFLLTKELADYEGYPWIAAFFVGIGFSTGVATFMSVSAAYTAIDQTIRRWMIVVPKLKNSAALPAVIGGGLHHSVIKNGKMSVQVIIITLSVAWIGIGIVLATHGAPTINAKPQSPPSADAAADTAAAEASG